MSTLVGKQSLAGFADEPFGVLQIILRPSGWDWKVDAQTPAEAPC